MGKITTALKVLIYRPRNVVRCNRCFDIIESVHVHDFVRCKCGKVAVDGGNEYHKRVGSECDYTEMSFSN